MQSIRIDSGMSIDEFDAAARNWQSASDCALEFPECLTESEIRYLTGLAVLRLPSDFAYCVLQSMAEFDNTPYDVLRGILDTGERAVPTPLHILSSFVSAKEQVAKEKAIQAAGERVWVWHTGQAMPALPPIAGRAVSARGCAGG